MSKPFCILGIFLIITFFSSQKSFGQLSIGSSYGFQVPGRQDLKFRYYENGELIKNIKTTYVKTDITNIFNLNVSYWENRFGVRVDYYNWEHKSTAKKFLTDELPPFFTVNESREALYISPMMRFNWPFKSENLTDFNDKYSYAGIGLGEANTEVEPGIRIWRAAFQLFYGISVPIAKNLRLQGDIKFLLTRDADNFPPKEDGWKVDTSGRWHPFRFGPHWDTKYHVFQLGLQWTLF